MMFSVRSILVCLVAVSACACSGPKTVCASGLSEAADGVCRPIAADAGSTTRDSKGQTEPSDSGLSDANPSDSGLSDANPCGATCAEPTPECDVATGECVACIDDSRCGGEAPLCDPTTHQCVKCLDDTSCGSAAPRCDPETHECVGCVTDLDCRGNTQVCDPTRQVCVECTEDAHCQDSTRPYCDPDTNACSACTATSQCDHLGDPEHSTCALTGPQAGTCVQCTEGNNESCAPLNLACSVVRNACSAFATDSQQTCEPCDADENCIGSHACVPMYFGPSHRFVGNFCAALPAGDLSCARPTSALYRRETVSGNRQWWCLPREAYQTCEAMGHLGDTCTTTADCDGIEGLQCLNVSTTGGTLKKCTVYCDADNQCVSNAAYDHCVNRGDYLDGHGACAN